MKIYSASRCSLILCFGLFFCHHLNALTTLTVINSASSGTGSLQDAIGMANQTQDDVLIEFNLANLVIDVNDILTINNVGGYSVTIDGINIQNTSSKVHLNRIAGGTVNKFWIFEILSSHVTLKNLELQGGDIGINLPSIDGDHLTVENCFIHDCSTRGVSILSHDCEVTQTRIENVKIGVVVNANNFKLGRNCVFIGNHVTNGKGVNIGHTCVNAQLGESTNDYNNYSFIGGFETGINISGDAEVSDMILGGKENRDYCSGTSISYANTDNIVLVNTNPDHKAKIGSIGANPSLILTNCQQHHINVLTNAVNIEINNTNMGFSPFWCNGDLPTSETTSNRAISIAQGENIRIGSEQGNVIENTTYAMVFQNTSDLFIENNQIGLSQNNTYSGIYSGITTKSTTNQLIKNNEIGDIETNAVILEDNTGITIEDNFIGVSNNIEQVFDTKVGVTFLGTNKDCIIDRNYFSATKFDLDLASCHDVEITNNFFDAFFNGNPINNHVDNTCIRVANDFLNVSIGQINKGNHFIGKNETAIRAYNNLAPWTDNQAVSHTFSTVSILSNEMRESTLDAISISRGVAVTIGEEDEPESGNIILKCNSGTGIKAISSIQHRIKISAHHNFIGITPNGEEGTLKRGILIQNNDADIHTLSNNTLVNCTNQFISLANVQFVKMSQNISRNRGHINLHGGSNLINSAVPAVPVFTGITQGAYHYILSGNSYPDATIELFRNKDGNIGMNSFIASIETDPNGDWTYTDILFAHKGFDGYYATVTTNGKTSQVSLLSSLCVTEDINNTACVFISNNYFVHLNSGEIGNRFMQLSNGVVGIYTEDFLSEGIPEYEFYDYKKRILLNVRLIEVDRGRYILDASKINSTYTIDHQRIYTLELKNRKGVITKYKFKI